MKNNARKMALENQIDLVQQNAIDFTHACMTIALHDLFGVGKDRLDKVTRRKDEINGELMRRMALPAKNRKAQLAEAEKWLVGLLPEGVISVFRIPVVKGVPRKRREVQLKMAIDKAATLEWRGYAAACAQVLGLGPQRLEKLRQETISNFGQLNEWVETDGVDVAMEKLCGLQAVRCPAGGCADEPDGGPEGRGRTAAHAWICPVPGPERGPAAGVPGAGGGPVAAEDPRDGGV